MTDKQKLKSLGEQHHAEEKVIGNWWRMNLVTVPEALENLRVIRDNAMDYQLRDKQNAAQVIINAIYKLEA